MLNNAMKDFSFEDSFEIFGTFRLCYSNEFTVFTQENFTQENFQHRRSSTTVLSN